jgi:SH3 domain protein
MKVNTAHKAIALATLVLLLALPLAAQARTVYVSDELVITMRTGKGPGFKIIDYLERGTPLEVLQEEGSYTKVRTSAGKEGWVLSRFITAETPKDKVIEGLEKEIKDLKATMGDALETASERDRLLEENKRLKADNERLDNKIRRTERRELMYWFLAGAGVLFVGWVIGKASRQKRFY